MSVCQMQSDIDKQRTSDHVLARRGIHRVKTHRGEDVPGRHLPAVFIPGHAVWLVGVVLLSNTPHLRLRFPRRATVVVEVTNMVAGFVIVPVMSTTEVLVQPLIEILRTTQERD